MNKYLITFWLPGNDEPRTMVVEAEDTFRAEDVVYAKYPNADVTTVDAI